MTESHTLCPSSSIRGGLPNADSIARACEMVSGSAIVTVPAHRFIGDVITLDIHPFFLPYGVNPTFLLLFPRLGLLGQTRQAWPPMY